MNHYALISFVLLSCSQHVKPKPAPVSSDWCDTAFVRLSELKCKEAVPTFTEACKRAITDGRNWRPDCLAVVATCADIETAYRTPEGKACK